MFPRICVTNNGSPRRVASSARDPRDLESLAVYPCAVPVEGLEVYGPPRKDPVDDLFIWQPPFAKGVVCPSLSDNPVFARVRFSVALQQVLNRRGRVGVVQIGLN